MSSTLGGKGEGGRGISAAQLGPIDTKHYSACAPPLAPRRLGEVAVEVGVRRVTLQVLSLNQVLNTPLNDLPDNKGRGGSVNRQAGRMVTVQCNPTTI